MGSTAVSSREKVKKSKKHRARSSSSSSSEGGAPTREKQKKSKKDKEDKKEKKDKDDKKEKKEKDKEKRSKRDKEDKKEKRDKSDKHPKGSSQGVTNTDGNEDTASRIEEEKRSKKSKHDKSDKKEKEKKSKSDKESKKDKESKSKKSRKEEDDDSDDRSHTKRSKAEKKSKRRAQTDDDRNSSSEDDTTRDAKSKKSKHDERRQEKANKSEKKNKNEKKKKRSSSTSLSISSDDSLVLVVRDKDERGKSAKSKSEKKSKRRSKSSSSDDSSSASAASEAYNAKSKRGKSDRRDKSDKKEKDKKRSKKATKDEEPSSSSSDSWTVGTKDPKSSKVKPAQDTPATNNSPLDLSKTLIDKIDAGKEKRGKSDKKGKKDKKKKKKRSNFDDSTSSSSSSSTESVTPIATKTRPERLNAVEVFVTPQRAASSATLTDYHKLHPTLSPSSDQLNVDGGFQYRAGAPLDAGVSFADFSPTDGVFSPKQNPSSEYSFGGGLGGSVNNLMGGMRSFRKSNMLGSMEFGSPQLGNNAALGGSYGSPAQAIPLLDSTNLVPGSPQLAVAKLLGERLLTTMSVWDQPFDIVGLMHYTAATVSSFARGSGGAAQASSSSNPNTPRPAIENIVPPRLLPPPPTCRAFPVCGTLRCHLTRTEFGDEDYDLNEFQDPLGPPNKDGTIATKKNKKLGLLTRAFNRAIKPNEGTKFRLFTDVNIDSFIPRGVLADGEKASYGAGCGVCHGAADQWRAGSWGNRSGFPTTDHPAMRSGREASFTIVDGSPTSQMGTLQRSTNSVACIAPSGGERSLAVSTNDNDHHPIEEIVGVQDTESERRYILSARKRAHKTTPNFIISAQPLRTLAFFNNPRSAYFGTLDTRSMVRTRPGLSKVVISSVFTSAFAAHVMSPCGYIDRHLRKQPTIANNPASQTLAVAKMRGNFGGTQFVIYDDGLNPQELKKELKAWVRAVEKAGRPFERRDEKKAHRKLKRIGEEVPLISAAAAQPSTGNATVDAQGQQHRTAPANLEEARKAALEGWTRNPSGEKVYALPLAAPPRLRCELGAIIYLEDQISRSKPYRCQRVVLPAVDPETGASNSCGGESVAWFQDTFLSEAIKEAGGRGRVNAAFAKYWKGTLVESTPEAERKATKEKAQRKAEDGPPPPKTFAQELDNRRGEVAAVSAGGASGGKGVKGFFSRLFGKKEDESKPTTAPNTSSSKKGNENRKGEQSSSASSSTASAKTDASEDAFDAPEGAAAKLSAGVSKPTEVFSVILHTLHRHEKEYNKVRAALIAEIETDKEFHLSRRKHLAKERERHLKARSKRRKEALKGANKASKKEGPTSPKVEVPPNEEEDKKSKLDKKEKEKKSDKESKKDKESKSKKSRREDDDSDDESSSSSSSRSGSDDKKRDKKSKKSTDKKSKRDKRESKSKKDKKDKRDEVEVEVDGLLSPTVKVLDANNMLNDSKPKDPSSSSSSTPTPSLFDESTTLEEYCDLEVEELLYGKVLPRRRAPDGTCALNWRWDDGDAYRKDVDRKRSKEADPGTNNKKGTPSANTNDNDGVKKGPGSSRSFQQLVVRCPLHPNSLNPNRSANIPGAGVRQPDDIFGESEALYSGGILSCSPQLVEGPPGRGRTPCLRRVVRRRAVALRHEAQIQG